MGAPPNDIGINPFTTDRREFSGCVATVATIKYGMIVKGDTATTNARDVKIPVGAGETGLRGVVSDQGDPNNTGLFAIGDEFACCTNGDVEILLDAGQIAVKDAPFISGATAGTAKPIAAESAPYDIGGYFSQSYDNSAGIVPVLVSARVNVQRRVA